MALNIFYKNKEGHHYVLWVDEEGYPYARFKTLMSLIKYTGVYNMQDILYVEEIDWLNKFMDSPSHMRIYDIVTKDGIWNPKDCRIVVYDREGEILKICKAYTEFRDYCRKELGMKNTVQLNRLDQYYYRYDKKSSERLDTINYVKDNERNEIRYDDYGGNTEIFISCHLSYHPVLPATHRVTKWGTDSNLFTDLIGVHTMKYLPYNLYMQRLILLKKLDEQDDLSEITGDNEIELKYNLLYKSTQPTREL